MRLFSMGMLWMLLAASTAVAVTVDGNCYLEGQTDHAGIKVKFVRVSPSAMTDSTYTDASGYYSKNVTLGIYHVQYSRSGWTPFERANQTLTYTQTLPPVTIIQPVTEISGTLTGALGPGRFRVVGDLDIPESQSLTIQPGTRLLFTGPYVVQVQGTLSALGTASDSVVFTSESESQSSHWGGLYFMAQIVGPAGSGVLEYTAIDGSIPLDTWWTGGIQCQTGTSLTMRHCSIRNHSATNSVLYSQGANLILNDCAVEYNEASTPGYGTVHLEQWSGNSILIENSRFAHNSTTTCDVYITGDATIRGCTFELDLNLSALSLWYGNPVVENCAVSCDGTALTVGAGHPVVSNSRFEGETGLQFTSGEGEFSHCFFKGSYGASVYNAPQSLAFTNCTIAGQYNGLYLYAAAAHFNSCLIYGLSSWGYGAYFSQSANSQFTYSSIYCEPGTTPFNFVTGPEDAPLLFGQRMITNVNGDSTDIYMNIFEQPMVVDAAAGNYHLLPGSPCIDAGDPELPRDPDGTVADIGVFYFEQSLALLPGALAIGAVAVGSAVEAVATLHNIGDFPITLQAVTVGHPAFTAAYDPAESELTPGDSVRITVTFAPDSSCEYASLLSVATTTGSRSLALLGTGLGAWVDPVPGELNFLTEELGQLSVLSLALWNHGNSPLLVSSVTVLPPFTVLSFPDSVAAGTAGTVTVSFAPVSPGAFDGELLLATNAYNREDVIINVQGIGEANMQLRPVENLVLQTDAAHATLRWSPVTQTLQGNPVAVDAYLVYFSERSQGPFYFHGLSTDTSYVHENAALFARGMYYEVTAYVGELATVTAALAELPQPCLRDDLRRRLHSAAQR